MTIGPHVFGDERLGCPATSSADRNGMDPMWRYVIRCVLTGVAAAASSLLTAMPGLNLDDALMAGLLGLLAALSYAGIGAGSTKLEPGIGRTE